MAMNKNNKVKFTVIIPTRERCEVLKSALKTCTAQEYDNLEIIVSDNASEDKTKEVVESFRDNRISYINTGKRVSMTDNWEFALSHVDGGYVTYLGDDDGLLPGSLVELNEVISQTGTEAIACKTAIYFWPDYKGESKRNTLIISLRTSLVKRNSKEMLIDVINFRRSYDELPLLYRGFVSYKVIKKVMQESGRFFHSMIPDVYSGIALASILESYYYSFKPYTISGASCHSHGGACSNISEDNQTYKKFFSENNLSFHSKFVFAPSGPIFVAESFLQAQGHVPYARNLKIDIKKCLKAAIIEVVHYPEKLYETVADAVKKIACLNQIEPYALQIIAAHKNFPPRFYNPVLGFNILRGQLVIDCAEFGVRNVYDAAVLCRHILVLEKSKFFSANDVIKTTISLAKREIINKSLTSRFLKIH